jgi:biotin transport system substrate-specific component
MQAIFLLPQGGKTCGYLLYPSVRQRGGNVKVPHRDRAASLGARHNQRLPGRLRMKSRTTASMVLCAFFAALSAVLSQLTVAVGPVPVNFTHISVFMSAGLLGARYGAVSQAVFVLLGAAGLPVFSGFGGGMPRILGPTGGFIVGYIFCALASGLIMDRLGRGTAPAAASMAAGLAVSYFTGTLWYMYITKSALMPALTACVFPFVAFDLAKIAFSAVLVNRLCRALSPKSGAAG